jgi:HK97 family phage portal protein
MLKAMWHRLFGPRDQAVDSAQVRKGDGVWEAFVGTSHGAPTEREALSVSAVYGCVTLIAGAISALPMHIYRQDIDLDRTRDTVSPLWWVLNEEFAPRWTAAAGWSFLAGSRLLHGDAFAEIVRNRAGAVRYIVPLHPDRVRVIASPDGMRLVYEVQPDRTIEAPSPEASRIRVLDQDDVLHVPGFGFNGLRGMSPLRYALRSAGRLAINAQDFSTSFLRNMGRPDYVLETDKALTDDQFERLRQQMDEHKGPINAGKPIILEGGLKVHALTMPLEEMQLLETRKWQVEEIARIYGVPPFMIGHQEKSSSWGTGIEAMGAGFVRYTLRDHLNAFQNEINRKFFRTARTVAEFDTTELERANTAELFSAMRLALGRAGEPAFMSIEEVRQKLNLPRKMNGTTPIPEPDETEAPDEEMDE